MNRLERVFAVFCVVARRHIEFLVSDVRRDYLLVAVFFLYSAQELFQTVAQGGSFRQPQRQALAHPLREREQFQVLAQFAVVAFLRFLHHRKVFVQHRLLRERNAVDAGQHLVLFVSAPVGSRHRGQFYRLDVARVRDVRAAAQVGERAVRVERNRAVFQVGYQFDFIGVAFFREIFQGFGFRDFAAHQFFLVARKFLHLLFYLFQVGFRYRRRAVHVVVEAVFDGRAYAEFDARIEGFQRFGQQVRRRVPECVFAFGVVPFVESDRSVFFDRARHVDRRAVYRGGQRVGS